MAWMINFMLHIFHFSLKQPREEEDGEERKEVCLLAQFIQAVVTTRTLLMILEAGKSKIKSLIDCGSCEASRCTKVPYLLVFTREELQGSLLDLFHGVLITSPLNKGSTR